MPGVRGNSFATINRWLGQNLSVEDYRELISSMRPPVTRILTKPEGWSWYPLEYLSEILLSLKDSKNLRNGETLDQLGRFLADEDMGGAPKTTTSFMPMPRVLPRVPFLWSRSMDCGDFNILLVSESENKASICLSGYDGGPMHCALIRAWLERTFELMSGGKVSVEETSCRYASGGNACHWEVSWE